MKLILYSITSIFLFLSLSLVWTVSTCSVDSQEAAASSGTSHSLLEALKSIQINTQELGLPDYLEQINTLNQIMNKIVQARNIGLAAGDTQGESKELEVLNQEIHEEKKVFWEDHFTTYETLYTSLSTMNSLEQTYVYYKALEDPAFVQFLSIIEKHIFLLETEPEIAQLFSHWTTLNIQR